MASSVRCFVFLLLAALLSGPVSADTQQQDALTSAPTPIAQQGRWIDPGYQDGDDQTGDQASKSTLTPALSFIHK